MIYHIVFNKAMTIEHRRMIVLSLANVGVSRVISEGIVEHIDSSRPLPMRLRVVLSRSFRPHARLLGRAEVGQYQSHDPARPR